MAKEIVYIKQRLSGVYKVKYSDSPSDYLTFRCDLNSYSNELLLLDPINETWFMPGQIKRYLRYISDTPIKFSEIPKGDYLNEYDANFILNIK